MNKEQLDLYPLSEFDRADMKSTSSKYRRKLKEGEQMIRYIKRWKIKEEDNTPEIREEDNSNED